MEEETLSPQPPQSVETETPQEPKTDYLKIGLLVFVGLVLLVGAAYAGYWYASRHQVHPARPEQSRRESAEGPTPTLKDETANWKTYRNTHFNYTVKYPPDLQFRAIKHEDVEVGFELKKESKDIPRITVEAAGAGTSYERETFDDYVKHAAPSEIQGYKSIYSMDKVISDFGVAGYKVTWNCRDLDGSEFISKPFYYYPPGGKFKISLQPIKTIQIHVDALLEDLTSSETLEFDRIAKEIAESYDFVQK